MGRRILVSGSRTVHDAEFVFNRVSRHRGFIGIPGRLEPIGGHDIIIQGGAGGVDRLAKAYADKEGLQCITLPAQWDAFERHEAGRARNELMAYAADVLVAIWDGRSGGTRDMISRALDLGLETHVYIYDRSV